ncbi:aldose epimerase family protein [Sediminibacillus albus]|uniref:Aldose 1-epimerase n=1 Tax=Sediminibacillus albus TaxID=407036 RepID=A0A1G8ZUB3_9BACI|nr:aldose epimerase family protein [Sediminibacillus albus]SDK18591.1 aldose 1-epimerase [Sediminibacillus albus]
MQINQEEITLSNQQKWTRFTLKNDLGMEVSCLDFGGIITDILVPDINGKMENVVIGYQNEEDYLDNPNYFGALIGRVAGRIAGSSFTLEGKKYRLPANEGSNHLHGGPNAFNKVIWETAVFEEDNQAGVTFSRQSNDGENGYPGNVKMQITYTLDNQNNLVVTYRGKSDQDTFLTTTNHSYFNLSGDLKNGIQEHKITIDSSQFVELDNNLIPTGRKLATEGTVFDFRHGRQIRDGIDSTYEQNQFAGNGYDHYFIFDHHQPEQVIVFDEKSRRQMTVKTDQPGMVMYTSNTLKPGLNLKEGNSQPYLGICLETQASPASIHHEGFPSCFLAKDEDYFTQTSFHFEVK